VTTETRYHPNAEQRALAGTIGESIDDLLPLARLHASPHEDAKSWRSLEDMGIFGIGVSEEFGGSGLGAAEESLIVMGLGRRLASPAVFATIGAAHAQVVSDAVVRGSPTAAAYQRGNRSIIVDEPEASQMLLRGSGGASVHRLRKNTLRSVDDRLWLGALRETPANELEPPLGHISPSQLARLRLIDAAALAGMAEAALEMSVSYAGIRQQFGHPIGSFQAVKHHCANMAIAARCARDQAGFAAVALDEGRADAALQVECAFFVAGSAALENAAKNIQIHGGMGFSDEADPHLILKRAQLMVAIAGGLEAANERIGNIKAEW
jgi:alkylation response protein AidB-like acyl-CoA dehydrogenase